MDILYAQFNIGKLSLDEIKTVLGSDFGSCWPALQKKFVKDESTGLYYNERLLFEKVRRSEFSKNQSDRVKKRWYKSGNTNNENESENEIKNEVESRKGGVGENLIQHLNMASGRNFKPSNQLYLRRINQRLKEGYTPEELTEIIDLKVAEWKGTEMERHLNPDTLFGKEKCNKYRDQVRDAKDKNLTLAQIRGGKNGNTNLAQEVQESLKRKFANQ